jgi:hypothetical protein
MVIARSPVFQDDEAIFLYFLDCFAKRRLAMTMIFEIVINRKREHLIGVLVFVFQIKI